jgi:hypothetical protein
MCYIESVRRKVDTMILDAIEPFWFSGPWNEAALTECAVASLSDQFGDLCTEACIRARCEKVVAGALEARCATAKLFAHQKNGASGAKK